MPRLSQRVQLNNYHTSSIHRTQTVARCSLSCYKMGNTHKPCLKPTLQVELLRKIFHNSNFVILLFEYLIKYLVAKMGCLSLNDAPKQTHSTSLMESSCFMCHLVSQCYTVLIFTQTYNLCYY